MENMKCVLDLGNPLQIGLVVKNARSTSELLSSLFGIGPWRFEDWPPPNRPEWESFSCGKPAQWKVKLAFADFNNLEIELIECIEGENGYTEFLTQKGEGVHHLLFEVDDLDATEAALAEHGIRVRMGATGRRPGTRWILADTLDTLGFTLEIRNRLFPGDAKSAT